jgi:hypothetical protein
MRGRVHPHDLPAALTPAEQETLNTLLKKLMSL